MYEFLDYKKKKKNIVLLTNDMLQVEVYLHSHSLSRWLRRNTNKMQLTIEFITPNLLKAQHVSSGTPLIIRSSKLYLQPVVYIPVW